MSKISTGIKYWLQILLLPLYAFSYLFPRKSNIWLYGSTFGRRFADSPKYFFLYMNQYHKKDIRSIWITKNRVLGEELKAQGYEAYYLYSLRGVFYSCTGGVYLYDNYTKDISFWLSGRAKKINLWHGIPLKKINMDNRYDEVRHPKTFCKRIKYWLRRLSDERPSHYVVATSSFISGVFSSAFATKNLILCGYPRNDVLISDKIHDFTLHHEEWLSWLEQKKSEGNQVITYMPTFRASEIRLFELLDFDKLEGFLQTNSLVLCIKAHPKSKINQLLKEVTENRNFQRIFFVDAAADPYQMLKRTDMLLTDYSSIYFDFLLLNRPIIFFPYDFDEYLTNSRELYFDYEEYTPGPKAYDWLGLQQAIMEDDQYAVKRERLKQKMFSAPEALSSELLYYQIKGILK